MACAMARKRRFRFGLPIVFAGRPSVGGVGLGCQPIRFAAAARFGALGSVLPDSVLSDSKSPRRIFRRGLNSCDDEDIQVICPTCQNVFAGSLKRPDHATLHGVVFDIFVERCLPGSAPSPGWWMTLRPSTLINRHKTAVPPSVAPAHSLRLRWNSDPFHSDPFHDEAKMFPKPKPVLVPNTYAFESGPMVKATGFREYDARWLFEKEINLMGIQALGMGLGALIAELGVKQEIVVGHDFRSYSASIKYALMSGLMAAGCKVHDIGLAVTPMAYFAQFDLDVPCVAMVTASHNDNGWTGVKMGANRPLTFGPDEMNRLKEIVLHADFKNKVGGSYQFHENFPARYIADLTRRPKLKRKLKVVVACGNGTAGAFAPQVMQAIGCEVVPLDTELNHTFPKYNPNPEDMEMLHAIRDAVLEHKADVGLGFDGDGDRCGVVDNTGEEIFADKVGVLLARDMSAITKDARFVVDVKSTGLFVTDPVLQKQGARVA